MRRDQPGPTRSRRRIGRDVAIVLAAAAAIVVPVGPARAQQYQGCQATVSALDVVPGQTIVVTGSGAEPTSVEPGSAVSAAMTELVGRGEADRDGNFSFSAVVPGDVDGGAHPMTVDCGNGQTTITLLVLVGDNIGTAPPRGPPIPYTGSGTAFPVARAGLALCALGAIAVAASRRRRWADDRR